MTQLSLPCGNPHWLAYCRTTAAPTNHGFMAWITRQARAFTAETGRPPSRDRGGFTAWLEKSPRM